MFNYFAYFYDYFLRLSESYTVQPIWDHVNFDNYSDILDVGGGTGYLGNKLKQKRDLNYYIVDYNYNMLVKASKKELNGCILSSSAKLPFKNDVFDFVICSDALHHFKDKEKSLKEMYRVLKKEGKLILFDLIPNKFVTTIICYIERFLGEQTNFYSSKEIQEILNTKLNCKKINNFQFLLTIKKK